MAVKDIKVYAGDTEGWVSIGDLSHLPVTSEDGTVVLASPSANEFEIQIDSGSSTPDKARFTIDDTTTTILPQGAIPSGTPADDDALTNALRLFTDVSGNHIGFGISSSTLNIAACRAVANIDVYAQSTRSARFTKDVTYIYTGSAIFSGQIQTNNITSQAGAAEDAKIEVGQSVLFNGNLSSSDTKTVAEFISNNLQPSRGLKVNVGTSGSNVNGSVELDVRAANAPIEDDASSLGVFSISTDGQQRLGIGKVAAGEELDIRAWDDYEPQNTQSLVTKGWVEANTSTGDFLPMAGGTMDASARVIIPNGNSVTGNLQVGGTADDAIRDGFQICARGNTAGQAQVVAWSKNDQNCYFKLACNDDVSEYWNVTASPSAQNGTGYFRITSESTTWLALSDDGTNKLGIFTQDLQFDKAVRTNTITSRMAAAGDATITLGADLTLDADDIKAADGYTPQGSSSLVTKAWVEANSGSGTGSLPISSADGTVTLDSPSADKFTVETNNTNGLVVDEQSRVGVFGDPSYRFHVQELGSNEFFYSGQFTYVRNQNDTSVGAFFVNNQAAGNDGRSIWGLAVGEGAGSDNDLNIWSSSVGDSGTKPFTFTKSGDFVVNGGTVKTAINTGGYAFYAEGTAPSRLNGMLRCSSFTTAESAVGDVMLTLGSSFSLTAGGLQRLYVSDSGDLQAGAGYSPQTADSLVTKSWVEANSGSGTGSLPISSADSTITLDGAAQVFGVKDDKTDVEALTDAYHFEVSSYSFDDGSVVSKGGQITLNCAYSDGTLFGPDSGNVTLIGRKKASPRDVHNTELVISVDGTESFGVDDLRMVVYGDRVNVASSFTPPNGQFTLGVDNYGDIAWDDGGLWLCADNTWKRLLAYDIFQEEPAPPPPTTDAGVSWRQIVGSQSSQLFCSTVAYVNSRFLRGTTASLDGIEWFNQPGILNPYTRMPDWQQTDPDEPYVVYRPAAEGATYQGLSMYSTSYSYQAGSWTPFSAADSNLPAEWIIPDTGSDPNGQGVRSLGHTVVNGRWYMGNQYIMRDTGAVGVYYECINSFPAGVTGFPISLKSTSETRDGLSNPTVGFLDHQIALFEDGLWVNSNPYDKAGWTKEFSPTSGKLRDVCVGTGYQDDETPYRLIFAIADDGYWTCSIANNGGLSGWTRNDWPQQGQYNHCCFTGNKFIATTSEGTLLSFTWSPGGAAEVYPQPDLDGDKGLVANLCGGGGRSVAGQYLLARSVPDPNRPLQPGTEWLAYSLITGENVIAGTIYTTNVITLNQSSTFSTLDGWEDLKTQSEVNQFIAQHLSDVEVQVGKFPTTSEDGTVVVDSPASNELEITGATDVRVPAAYEPQGDSSLTTRKYVDDAVGAVNNTTIWQGTQTEYDAIPPESLDDNTLYLISGM